LQVAVEAWIDRQNTDVAEQQGVAIGGGTRDEGGADTSAGAGPVIDDHRSSSVSEIFSATERARMSVRPPGVNGTTIVMFADGQGVCAHTQRGASEAAAAAEARPRMLRRRTVQPSHFFGDDLRLRPLR